MTEELDRIAVPDDDKKRVLDLSASNFAVPETGIHEGTMRCYMASLEWAKIIEGHVSWLAEIAAWTDAEDENYFAIQQILIFLQGVDCMSIDYEAWYDANRRAIYDAVNDVAKQIVSGRVTDILVNSEGVASDPTSGDIDVDLPEDDPETPLDESKAATYGGVFALGVKIEQLLDKIDSLYGVTNGSPTTTEADAIAIMSAYYPSDENLMSSAVSAYYAYRVTTAQFAFSVSNDFIPFLYCNGYDLSAINRFMIDNRSYPIAKVTRIGLLLEALLPEFWNDNFARGSQSPSSAYLDTPCEITPAQAYQGVPFTSPRSYFSLKANHRVLLTYKGFVTDADGDIQDAFWYRTAAGVLTRTNPSITYPVTPAAPSDALVAYNDDHIYSYTTDLGNQNGTMVITLNKHANITSFTYSPNAFEISFEDKGLPYGS